MNTENAENAESAETRRIMTARFNHTIIASKIPADMAVFYIDILEAAPQSRGGSSPMSRSVTG